MPDQIPDRTVYVQPQRGTDKSTVTWQHSITFLKNELAKKGFFVVDSRRDAAYIADFGYSVQHGQEVLTYESVPEYGVTGYTEQVTTTEYGGYIEETSVVEPHYGVTAVTLEETVHIEYVKHAKLDIRDKKDNRQVFDGSATIANYCPAFAPIAPYIIASMLIEFPKGKTGEVALEAENYDC